MFGSMTVVRCTLHKLFFFAGIVLLLNGCGGGGGGSDGGSGDNGDGSGSGSGSVNGGVFGDSYLFAASAMIDIEGDGDMDIVIGNQDDTESGSDLVLINDGAFNFRAAYDRLPTRYLGLQGATVNLAALDADLDGDSDLVAVTVDAGDDYYGNSKVQLWLNDGSGSFTDASANIPDNVLNEWAEWVRVGDVNADGAPDILLTRPGCGAPVDDPVVDTCTTPMYLNDGSGQFTKAPIVATDQFGELPSDYAFIWRSALSAEASLRLSLDLFIADLDGDGINDVFAPNGYAGGNFASFIATVDDATGALSYDVIYSYSVDPMGNPDPYISPRLRNGQMLDFDGDGDLDFVGSWGISGADNVTEMLGALENDGTGKFTVVTDTVLPDVPGVEHARQWLSADFNRDGHGDLFVADHGYDAMPFPGEPNLLLLSDGTGVLRDATASNLGLSSTYSHGASAGDLDGDGDIDLFINNSIRDDLAPLTWDNEGQFWRNDGTGNFTLVNAVLTLD